MFNVNALQKTLSAMSLPEIQKYAQLHKDDPYVVSMALSIANTKKEAQTAQQGLAGMQQMPKVAEQDIEGIAPRAAAPLPENVGIGQLPVQNMQHMAGGGIVAFEEGGHVPRYDGLTNGSVVNAPSAGTEYGIPGMLVGAPFTSAANPTLAARIAEIESLPRATRAVKDSLIAQARADANASPTALKTPPTQVGPGTQGAAPASSQDMAAFDKATADYMAQRAGNKQAPPDNTGAGLNKTLPSGQGIGFGASPLQAAGKWFESQLPAKEEAQKEEDYLKKRQDVWAGVNDKLADMIDKEKSKLGSEKEENLYMALIQGGLAAAAGTSQYALQNIAAGAGQGAKIYGEGLKDLRQAAKEINKMDMDQQKALAAQKIGDMDAYEKYSDRVADRNAKIDQLKASGLATLAGQTISGEYSLAGAREHAKAAGASGPLALYRELGGGDAAKGLQKYASVMGPEAKATPQLVATYAKNPAALEMLKSTDPALYASIKQQMTAMTMPQVQTTPSGAVRP